MQIAELIGSLNPLKIAADVIADWRRENTKRTELSSMERIRLVSARIEALRILSEHTHNFSQKSQKEIIERFFTDNCAEKDSGAFFA